MPPRLSILVPVFKSEQFFPRCVESILRQTFTDFELILIDDGSPRDHPGNAAELCEEYRRSDPRVRVIRQEHRGVTAARQAGATAAAGEYIGFVDSDDWIDPDMFQVLIDAAEESGADITACGFLLSFPRRERRFSINVSRGVYDKQGLQSQIYPTMLFDPAPSPGTGFRRIPPALWSKIFKRDLLLQNLLAVEPEITFGEDAAVTYPALLQAERLCVLSGFHPYHYRVHRDSLSSRYKENYLSRILLLAAHLNEKSRAADTFDLSGQIDGNLCYFAVQACFNAALGGVSFAEQKSLMADIACRPAVSRAFERTNFTRFYPVYRFVAYCLKTGHFTPALLLTCFYPMIVRLYGQAL